MHEKYSWEGIKFEIVFEDSQGNPLDAENMVFRFIYIRAEYIPPGDSHRRATFLSGGS